MKSVKVVKAPPARIEQRTLAEQLRAMNKGPAPKQEGATGKRFTWSAPLVSPQKEISHSFESRKTDSAPTPANGTKAPASHDLREVRRMVAKVRRTAKEPLK